ncbi:hypothetical protein ACFXDE_38440 [Kitasatospora sp. NPDC059408]|uniref:hypothetical protein n=1 Tax=Kitasatospora sp. NPDC059408 TaxID=3346823 RepID=UPI0036B6A1A5
MARTVRHPRSRTEAIAHHNRQVAGVTAALLVVISLYTVVIGPDGWLWFAWAVLLLSCVALFTIRG